MLTKEGGTATISVLRLKAHLATRNLEHEDAEGHYMSANKAFKALDRGYADIEMHDPSPQKRILQSNMQVSTKIDCANEPILPLVQSQLLQNLSESSLPLIAQSTA